MKTVIRITATFFTVIGSYFFMYWMAFMIIPGAQKIQFLAPVTALIIAILMGIFIWKKTGNAKAPKSMFVYVLVGGILLGTIGFILGFFGPLIFSPSSNQGPLLGIILTGPIGFMAGLLSGGLYWVAKVKKR
jgi:hypothetical protein